MKKYLCVFVLLLAAFAAAVSANDVVTGSISVKVVNEKDEGLSYADVILDGVRKIDYS